METYAANERVIGKCPSFAEFQGLPVVLEVGGARYAKKLVSQSPQSLACPPVSSKVTHGKLGAVLMWEVDASDK